MGGSKDHFLIVVVLFFSIPKLYGQEFTVKGKITDSNSGDPLPFVNVIYKGTSIGSTTDFEGNYVIKTKTPGDSLVASYIGYRTKTKAVTQAASQVINFQMEEDATKLQEIVVTSGENPAFEI